MKKVQRFQSGNGLKFEDMERKKIDGMIKVKVRSD